MRHRHAPSATVGWRRTLDWALDYTLNWGFRPFFLAGALWGVAAALYWALAWRGAAPLPEGLAPVHWHAHEMVFGFGGAALAGFLLTAVPSWTGTLQVRGRALAALAGLWLAGRVTMALAGPFPPGLATVVNLAFPLALALVTLGPLWRDTDRRHAIFVAAVALFLAAQIAAHLGFLGFGEDADLARRGLLGGLHALVFAIIAATTRISMVTVRLALDEQGDTVSEFRPLPYRRNLAAAAYLVFAAGDILWPDTPVTGWLALAAGAAQMDRLTDFHVGRVLLRPYVLLLYTANLWIGLGGFAMGIDGLAGLGAGADLRHLFAIGAIGTAVLTVFTIAGLNHSDMDLVIPRRVLAALALLFAGTLMRGAGTLAPPWFPHGLSVDGSALCFALAFALYLSRFVPILLGWRRPPTEF